MNKDDIEKAFSKLPLRRFDNTLLDPIRDRFIQMQKDLGYLDARHVGPDIRDIVLGWVPPEKYTIRQKQEFGDKRFEVPKYRTDTRIGHVVEKSVLIDNEIKSVWYYLCFRDTEWGWNKSWAEQLNMTKYKGKMGMKVPWMLAVGMYMEDVETRKNRKHLLDRTSLVICLTNKFTDESNFWYAYAPDIIDHINKHNPKDLKDPEHKGCSQMTDYGAKVFGVPLDKFSDKDVFKYPPPLIA